HFVQPCALSCTPATLSRDDLERAGLGVAYHNGLDHSLALDALGKFVQRGVFEALPWLSLLRLQLLDGYALKLLVDLGRCVCGCHGQECIEPPAEHSLGLRALLAFRVCHGHVRNPMLSWPSVLARTRDNLGCPWKRRRTRLPAFRTTVLRIDVRSAG